MHGHQKGPGLGKLGSALADARHRATAAAVLVGGARALVLAMIGLLAVLASAQGSDGTFDRTWGKDVGGPGVGVCTVAANCQAGTQGGLGGEFGGPGFDATDAAGNVYVADNGNERIQKFDSSGTFLRAWGGNVGGSGVKICTVAANCHSGSAGVQGGEFSANGPDGVATDAAGNVYVTEFFGNRIQKFDSSGTFLLAWGKDVGGAGVHTCTVAASCQAGATGSAGGDFSGPEDVATDSAGNVYVTDADNSRVQKFDSSGTFLLAWGKDVGGAGVHTCTVAATCRAGTRGGEGDSFSNPTGVGTDATGSVYITDQNLFRVQKFDSSGAFLRAWGKDVGGPGVEFCTVAANCQMGTSGVQGGEFSANGPAGVATDEAGNVYVANAAAGGRVQKFDSSGAFLRAWGKDVGGAGMEICTVAANCQLGAAGGLGGEFDSPAGVATDSGGGVYVADSNNRRIQKFAPDVISPGPPPAPPASGGATPPVTSPSNPSAPLLPAAAAGVAASSAGHVVAIGCVANKLILTDVFPRAGKTQLLGVAPAAARGKRVTIFSAWNGKPVAKPTVQSDLSFTATAPLPPRALRFTNRARYVARFASESSLVLKLARRMYTTAISGTGQGLRFSGTVTRPLDKPVQPVVIRASASCPAIAAGTIVASVKPSRSGAFTASIKLPAGLQKATAIYLRAQTKVRKVTTSKKTFDTFTLIRGVRIG